jgi:hypothetical protein
MQTAPIIVDGQSSTLNLNQASCMIERPLLEGREFVNVCTGQKTLVPYSGPEIVFGIFFAVFFLCILTFVGSTFVRVMGGRRDIRRGF